MCYCKKKLKRKKKALRVFWELPFIVGCTRNMVGAPSNTQTLIQNLGLIVVQIP